MNDKEFSKGLYSKMSNLLLDLEITSMRHLEHFSFVELEEIQKLYGQNLSYDLHRDVVHMVEEKTTRVLH